MAHVPPPPHAEGRNIFWLDKVDNNDDPAETTTGLPESPLMTIFTGPLCTNFD